MAIIPGQSLTATPKNAPYENAPSMTKPEDAIMWHLERMSEPEKTSAILDALEMGIDVVTMTEGLLRFAVLDGRHSIDVSLIIAPVVHEFIVSTADEVGIEYEEGIPDGSKGKKQIKYQINSRKASKKLAKLREDGDIGSLPAPSPVEAAPVDMMAEPVESMGAEAPKGLMARPTNDKGIV